MRRKILETCTGTETIQKLIYEGFEISELEGNGWAFFRFEQRPLVFDAYATVVFDLRKLRGAAHLLDQLLMKDFLKRAT